MDTKSAGKGNCSGRWSRYCGICTATVSGLIILAGCACFEQQDHCTQAANPVLEEARVYLLEGDEDLAIESLKEEMTNGTETCTVAFYLFFLDPSSSEYLDRLTTAFCSEKYPLNHRVVQRFLAYQRKLEKCTRDRWAMRKRLKALSGKLQKAESQRKKLGFELKKLEQIRRETERLRLNK